MTRNDSAVELSGTWQFKVDSLDEGIKESWFTEGFNRSDWSRVHVPDFWDRYNLASYDGVGWFAKSFEATKSGKPLTLYFGGVDDDADIWLNGTKVGSHVGYSDAFFFDVTSAVRPGHNELVVRVFDKGGPGGIYRPITLLPTAEVDKLLHGKYSAFEARRSEDWIRDAVIYEVYVRSFSKEGTFRGLEGKLGELKELGVTVLWLMPIHPVGELKRKGTLGSPYSIQDYYGINPEFGTLDDFRSLVKAVHANGMKIIIDLVANHTSWDSKLILEHPEWFTKNSHGAIVSPNADWTDVADLDFSKPGLRKYMTEMMKYWVREIGIDGYRCDVAEMVPTDFWDAARAELEAIKPVIMISEGTIPEHHVRAFDLTYSWNLYDMMVKVVGGNTPVKVFDELIRFESLQFPRGSLRMRFNTNHDKNAWDAPAVEKYTREGAKASAVMAFTFPGVPMIYNGEEVGNTKRLALFEKVAIDWKRGSEFRDLYTRLIQLRRAHPSVQRGVFVHVENTGGEKIYSFARVLGKDTVYVLVNFSGREKDVRMSVIGPASGMFKDYFSSETNNAVNGTIPVHLSPYGFQVFLPLQ
ncbi:MAG: alpha-amylase family glycosyl hydrolase [Bacteroidota bacterium]